ncbi:conserved hypothetical protein [Treponema phagedenis]|uniref:Uncharacterized protein n=1 Tax=Treponema phagedenis TaxID=162 RepID=A0A0B7GVF4_TREPH|nr:hypothetical protein HMPREF9554_02985 [Treponema phagedenis F0421]CEM60656.1 conserved hypothetical protein [Treponema phagedenis]
MSTLQKCCFRTGPTRVLNLFQKQLKVHYIKEIGIKTQTLEIK